MKKAYIVALISGMFSCLQAQASEPAYPARPIRMIIGFPPGGTADILARAVASELTDAWGQPVVIDNRPGAGSSIGSDLAARAAPDGYTLLVVTSSHVVNAIVTKQRYHPVDSFTPITPLVSTAMALLSNPSVPVQSVRELVSLANAKPGSLNFGSSGSGSTTNLAGELFNNMAGIRLVHVPYKGGAASMNAVISGETQLLFISLPSAIPQIKAGRVRGLAVTTARRSAFAPEIPTIAESVPGYEAPQWYAMLAPAGMPAELTNKLNAQIVRILRMPKVVDFIAKLGADPESSPPQEFRAYLRAEVTKWTKVARQAGMVQK
ncbi:MAG: tripartite tricarboxylate transporter substrate binding protein [Betaproteobacteria bacterium]|nr:tripartite tricarboxylate transporter substrate binding protein [Betaproteobacteria bacterium]